MKLRFVLVLVAPLTVSAALAAACGGGGSDVHMNQKGTATRAQPDRTFTLQAKNVKFVPDKLTIPAGSVVEVKLDNLDATEHDFQVEGLDADITSTGSMNAGHGGTQMVAVHTMANKSGSIVFMAKKKGTYNFYCTITGHKEAGMVGTLTVE